MTLSTLRIVTRESPLAMWQARHVREALIVLHPALRVEILGITTQADRLLESSLSSLGGKGVFIKELEQALLSGRADIAVHSMKDVTTQLPAELALPVVLEREDPRDVLVSNNYRRFTDLPAGARVGTASLRRKCQLLAKRPELQVLDIRGNVGTRLRKLDENRFDALILAAAGVKRLGLQARISEYFSPDILLPAVSQGVLGIEIRAENTAVLPLIAPLADRTTDLCVQAERALNRRLGGDCHVPIAAYAQIRGSQLVLKALVGRVDGSEVVESVITGPAAEAESLGNRLGQELLDKGARQILQALDNKRVH